MGKGLVDRFKDEFDINDQWIPHELHPETPAEGKLLTESYDQFDIDQMTTVLRQRGEPYGIEFCDLIRASNTRLALEAAEFARDNDRYEVMHKNMFKAYFTDGLDIGNMDVLKAVTLESGLDPEAMASALEKEIYTERVVLGSTKAHEAGVTAIPTFVIEGQLPITGAVSEDLFRKALQAAAESC